MKTVTPQKNITPQEFRTKILANAKVILSDKNSFQDTREVSGRRKSNLFKAVG